MKAKYLLVLGVVALMVFAPYNASGDQLADIKAAGKIVIGSDTTYPPHLSLLMTTVMLKGLTLILPRN